MATPEDWSLYGSLLNLSNVKNAFLVANPRLVQASPGYYSLSVPTINAFVTLIPPSSLSSFAVMSGWTKPQLGLLTDPESELSMSLSWDEESPIYFFARQIPHLKTLRARNELTDTAYYYLHTLLLKLCNQLARSSGPSNRYVPRTEQSLLLRGFLSFETSLPHEKKCFDVIAQMMKERVVPSSSRTSFPQGFNGSMHVDVLPSYFNPNPPNMIQIPFPVGLSKYPPAPPQFRYDAPSTSTSGTALTDNAHTGTISSTSTTGRNPNGVTNQGGRNAPDGVPNQPNPPITFHYPNFGPQGNGRVINGAGIGPGATPTGPVFVPPGAPNQPAPHPGAAPANPGNIHNIQGGNPAGVHPGPPPAHFANIQHLVPGGVPPVAGHPGPPPAHFANIQNVFPQPQQNGHPGQPPAAFDHIHHFLQQFAAPINPAQPAPVVHNPPMQQPPPVDAAPPLHRVPPVPPPRPLVVLPNTVTAPQNGIAPMIWAHPPQLLQPQDSNPLVTLGPSSTLPTPPVQTGGVPLVGAHPPQLLQPHHWNPLVALGPNPLHISPAVSFRSPSSASEAEEETRAQELLRRFNHLRSVPSPPAPQTLGGFFTPPPQNLSRQSPQIAADRPETPRPNSVQDQLDDALRRYQEHFPVPNLSPVHSAPEVPDSDILPIRNQPSPAPVLRKPRGVPPVIEAPDIQEPLTQLVGQRRPASAPIREKVGLRSRSATPAPSVFTQEPDTDVPRPLPQFPAQPTPSILTPRVSGHSPWVHVATPIVPLAAPADTSKSHATNLTDLSSIQQLAFNSLQAETERLRAAQSDADARALAAHTQAEDRYRLLADALHDASVDRENQLVRQHLEDLNAEKTKSAAHLEQVHQAHVADRARMQAEFTNLRRINEQTPQDNPLVAQNEKRLTELSTQYQVLAGQHNELMDKLHSEAQAREQAIIDAHALNVEGIVSQNQREREALIQNHQAQKHQLDMNYALLLQQLSEARDTLESDKLRLTAEHAAEKEDALRQQAHNLTQSHTAELDHLRLQQQREEIVKLTNQEAEITRVFQERLVELEKNKQWDHTNEIRSLTIQLQEDREQLVKHITALQQQITTANETAQQVEAQIQSRVAESVRQSAKALRVGHEKDLKQIKDKHNATISKLNAHNKSLLAKEKAKSDAANKQYLTDSLNVNRAYSNKIDSLKASQQQDKDALIAELTKSRATALAEIDAQYQEVLAGERTVAVQREEALRVQIEKEKENARLLQTQLLSKEDVARLLAQKEAEVRAEAEEQSRRKLLDASTASEIAQREAVDAERKKIEAYGKKLPAAQRAQRDAEVARAAAEEKATASARAAESLQQQIQEATARNMTLEQLQASMASDRAIREKVHFDALEKLRQHIDKQQGEHSAQLAAKDVIIQEEKKRYGDLSTLRAQEQERLQHRASKPKGGVTFDKDYGRAEDVPNQENLGVSTTTAEPLRERDPRRPREEFPGDGEQLGPLAQAQIETLQTALAANEAKFNAAVAEAQAVRASAEQSIKDAVTAQEKKIDSLTTLLTIVTAQAEKSDSTVKMLGDVTAERDALIASVKETQGLLAEVKSGSSKQLKETRNRLRAEKLQAIKGIRSQFDKILEIQKVETRISLSKARELQAAEYDENIRKIHEQAAQEKAQYEATVRALSDQLKAASAAVFDRAEVASTHSSDLATSAVLGSPTQAHEDQVHIKQNVLYTDAIAAHSHEVGVALAGQAEHLTASLQPPLVGAPPPPFISAPLLNVQKHLLGGDGANHLLNSVMNHGAQLAQFAQSAEATPPSMHSTIAAVNSGAPSLPDHPVNLDNLQRINESTGSLGTLLPQTPVAGSFKLPHHLSEMQVQEMALHRLATKAVVEFQKHPSPDNQASLDHAKALLEAHVSMSEQEAQLAQAQLSGIHATRQLSSLPTVSAEDITPFAQAPSVEQAAIQNVHDIQGAHNTVSSLPTLRVEFDNSQQKLQRASSLVQEEAASALAAFSSVNGVVPSASQLLREQAADAFGDHAAAVANLGPAEATFTGKPYDYLGTLTKGAHVLKISRVGGTSDVSALNVSFKEKHGIKPNPTFDNTLEGRAQDARAAAREARAAKAAERREKDIAARAEAHSHTDTQLKDAAARRNQVTESLVSKLTAARSEVERQTAIKDAQAQLAALNPETVFTREQRRMQAEQRRQYREEQRSIASSSKVPHYGPRKERITDLKAISAQSHLVLPSGLRPDRATTLEKVSRIAKLISTRLSRNPPKVSASSKRFQDANPHLSTPAAYLGLQQYASSQIKAAHEQKPAPEFEAALKQLSANGYLHPNTIARVQRRLSLNARSGSSVPPSFQVVDPGGAYDPSQVASELKDVHSPGDIAFQVHVINELFNAAQVAEARAPGLDPTQAYQPLLHNLALGPGDVAENQLDNLARIADDEAISLDDRIDLLDRVAHAAASSQSDELNHQAEELLRQLVYESYQQPFDKDYEDEASFDFFK